MMRCKESAKAGSVPPHKELVRWRVPIPLSTTARTTKVHANARPMWETTLDAYRLRPVDAAEAECLAMPVGANAYRR